MPNIALELGKQSASLGVNAAYGEQRDVGGVQVIPVAISWTGFGGGSDEAAPVRHTEFWARMEASLGPAYARVWAQQQVLGELGGRTVEQALEAGESPKTVWRAVWSTLGLPAAER